MGTARTVGITMKIPMPENIQVMGNEPTVSNKQLMTLTDRQKRVQELLSSAKNKIPASVVRSTTM